MPTGFAAILAGIGFFFLGMKLLEDYLKQLFTLNFQAFIIRALKNNWIASVVGFIAGIFSAESALLTFLVANISSNEGINLKRTLPLINWQNPGGCLLLFIIFFNIHFFFYIAIAVCSILLFVKGLQRFNSLFGFLAGMSTFVIGLLLMSSGTTSIFDMAETQNLTRSLIQENYIASFFLGIILSFLVQFYIVFLFCITLIYGQIIDLNQAILLMYGAHLGVALLTLTLFSHFKGITKRVMMSQVIFNVLVVAVFIPFTIIEIVFKIPLITRILTTTHLPPSEQIALFVFGINFILAFLLSFFVKYEAQLIEKYFPDDAAMSFSSPKFLNPTIIKTPTIGYSLLIRECAHFSHYMIFYFEEIKRMQHGQKQTKTQEIHRQFQKLFNSLRGYVVSFTSESMGEETIGKILNASRCLEDLIHLEESLYQNKKVIKTSLSDERLSLKMKSLINSLIEAEEAIFLSLLDLLDEPENETLELMLTLTSGKGELVENMRKMYAQTFSKNYHKYEFDLLIYFTGQFEKNVWLMRQITLNLRNFMVNV